MRVCRNDEERLAKWLWEVPQLHNAECGGWVGFVKPSLDSSTSGCRANNKGYGVICSVPRPTFSRKRSCRRLPWVKHHYWRAWHENRAVPVKKSPSQLIVWRRLSQHPICLCVIHAELPSTPNNHITATAPTSLIAYFLRFFFGSRFVLWHFLIL